jgi:hypothetical protein
MSEFRVMGIAVSAGRLGCVLLCNGNLVDCGYYRACTRSAHKTGNKTRELIALHCPEVVVTELPGSNKRKRGKTQGLMEAVTLAAKESEAVSMTSTKRRTYRDKYQEAKVLAERFPELLPRVPTKPKFWLNEPRRMILFEALSFALRLEETR